ncbi:SH3 domain protein [Oesophagostomum dentatum]|uniref:SH3 domain protein n=1 Tax=Oesophagostomum dentatum TaxID=61180 RepID=A0A0B1SAM0_OESDE|nr:SH3 domain protein [Oesophagostomum dentatum]
MVRYKLECSYSRPSASPSLHYNKDRFGGLLDEYSNRKSPSPLHPTSVRTATVIFKFDAKSPRELSLNRGEIVRLKREIDANWLEGERNGQSGIFPRSYVQLDDEYDRSRCKMRAVYPFTARNANELSLKLVCSEFFLYIFGNSIFLHKQNTLSCI